jgi:hypothetical protein
MTRIPYIALLSISKSAKIYWAKVFPQKPYNTILGLKFSPDGVLLIAHSGWIPNNNFIVVLNVATGNVLSARKYSSNSIDIYNHNVNSILVSSGSIPMAYVLSNILSPSCNGQRLFKFDPLKFRSTPQWSYQTNFCGHLGLTFGR